MTTLTLTRPVATRHPPSNGAHRLAWWLCVSDSRWEQIEQRLDVGLVDRLLSGEVEPSDELAASIARETEGEVLPEDWNCGGPLGWTDRPPARPPAWLQTR